ncbi:urea ABC transporter ATP-binding subunit UrtE [Thioflexithrix psekupsensis]|uniref:Urea ABC transporter ATP-binding subunit UrtE n=1 Tax=Thioflexithrix psekupsensis TaxID=1570016 RepID=A0A251X8B4_9GAMM|nr:urea ABC transporter ATP-binding subunit UrtE [Thioflexithrix psekupsensis]OUD14308.1 urea ABC transporter ATP-binding subunit UrtE [Thioflexithrix psekupsensis]
MLHIESLNQFYGESHTLWDINVTIPQGVCLCLMGRNGMGKTTLLKTLMGLLPAKSGQILFEGEQLLHYPADIRPKLGIAYVPQGREIFPQLTVEENLHIGLMAGKEKFKEIPEKIFQLFPVLKQMLKRRGGDLSGGQQQQLAIGRALAFNPKLLILDEPTEGIQPNIVREIGDIICHLNQDEGMTVLLVEQKLPFARRVAQEFCILDKGRAVSSGKMTELNDDMIQNYLTV